MKLAFVDTETTGLDPDRHEIWEVALIVREEVEPEPREIIERDGPEIVGRTLESQPRRMIDTEYVWQLPVDLARADLIALNIGRFHERRYPGNPYPISPFTMLGGNVEKIEHERTTDLPAEATERALGVVSEQHLQIWAERFVALTWGATILGMVPSFDEERLRRLLVRLGQCPGWHYRPVDVETLAAGYRAGRADQTIRSGGYVGEEFVPAIPWKSDALSKAIGVDPDQFDRHTALGDARWTRAIYDLVYPVRLPEESIAPSVRFAVSSAAVQFTPDGNPRVALGGIFLQYPDPTHGRIDLVVRSQHGNYSVVTGTPSGAPEAPYAYIPDGCRAVLRLVLPPNAAPSEVQRIEEE